MINLEIKHTSNADINCLQIRFTTRSFTAATAHIFYPSLHCSSQVAKSSALKQTPNKTSPQFLQKQMQAIHSIEKMENVKTEPMIVRCPLRARALIFGVSPRMFYLIPGSVCPFGHRRTLQLPHARLLIQLCSVTNENSNHVRETRSSASPVSTRCTLESVEQKHSSPANGHLHDPRSVQRKSISVRSASP